LNSVEKRIVFVFAALKLLIHFLTNTIYTFHRDEFLYIDEGKHLAWGYLEVPPLTPFLGRIFTTLAGDGVFGVRLLPAIVGVVMIFLIARLVKEFGGGPWALVLACIAFLLSPASLRTNTLFQPVCLDIMWWTLTVLFAIRIVKYAKPRDYYLLGITLGMGWMAKYSIAFIALALLAGLLLTSQRRNLGNKHFLATVLIGFCIALPNLIWQYNHAFPVVTHMGELASTQLVHVDPAGFVSGQFMMQFAGVLIWIPGLIWLFLAPGSRQYRFLGWAYVVLVITLLTLSGKDYYTLGIYPALFAAGGTGIEQYLRKRSAMLYALTTIVVLLDAVAMPIGLPILPVDKLVAYCDALAKLGFEQRWEDGKIYPIPQDYADMRGWEEPVATVAKYYHALPPEKQETCLIYGGGYAHVGPLNYYRKKYELPEAQSLYASYVLWIPDTLQFDNMFLVDNAWQDSTALFYHQEFLDSTHNKYARDPGYVFYRSDPRPGMDSIVTEIIRSEKQRVRLRRSLLRTR